MSVTDPGSDVILHNKSINHILLIIIQRRRLRSKCIIIIYYFTAYLILLFYKITLLIKIYPAVQYGILVQIHSYKILFL